LFGQTDRQSGPGSEGERAFTHHAIARKIPDLYRMRHRLAAYAQLRVLDCVHARFCSALR